MGGEWKTPAAERLLARRQINANGCWEWTGPISRDGYGRIGYQGRTAVGVHLVAYREWVGPVNLGDEVDHLCHTRDSTCAGGRTCPHRRCFYPAHLEAVTGVENVARGRSFSTENAAKTHCLRGHPLTLDNIHPGTWARRQVRRCLTCYRIQMAIDHARRAERRQKESRA